MKARLAEVHWEQVIWTAVLVYLATFLLGVVLSFLWLALLSGSHLSAGAAAPAFSLVTVLVVIVVTGYGAWRVARRAAREAILHGFLVGLIVALLSFVLDFVFSHQLQLGGLLLYLLMVASGWLGGVLGSRRGS